MERAMIEGRVPNAPATLDHTAAAVHVDPTDHPNAVESTAGLSSAASIRPHLLAPAPLANDWDEV